MPFSFPPSGERVRHPQGNSSPPTLRTKRSPALIAGFYGDSDMDTMRNIIAFVQTAGRQTDHDTYNILSISCGH
jgi:hypothetical protein